MAIIRSNKRYIQMEAVVSSTPTTEPGSFDDVALTADFLQDGSRTTSTSITSVAATSGKVYKGTPVNETTYSVTGLADDAATQHAKLESLSDAKTLVWVRWFDTIAGSTPASGDKYRQFQAYVGNLTTTFPNNDVVNFTFDLAVDEGNVSETSGTIS